MITLDEIRGYAMALPDVEEKTHFGRTGFRTRDKLFVVVHPQGDTDAILSVSQPEAAAAAAADPEVYEEVWRNNGQIFVGLRVDLAKIPPDRLRSLVELAWRNKAPKRLVSAFDQDR